MPKVIDESLQQQCAIFINSLKEKREEKRITTYTMESKTGIPQGNVTRMETSGSNPNLMTIIKYLNALDAELVVMDKEEAKTYRESLQVEGV